MNKWLLLSVCLLGLLMISSSAAQVINDEEIICDEFSDKTYIAEVKFKISPFGLIPTKEYLTQLAYESIKYHCGGE